MNNTPAPVETDWLSFPDLVELLDQPLGRVRRMLDEQQLVGSKRNGPFQVPAIFISEQRPLSSLRGTIIVLRDAGFSDDEVIDWLLSYESSMDAAPIQLLIKGHKSEVRRVARSLA